MIKELFAIWALHVANRLQTAWMHLQVKSPLHRHAERKTRMTGMETNRMVEFEEM